MCKGKGNMNATTLEEAALLYLEKGGDERLGNVMRAADVLIRHFSAVYCGAVPNDDMMQAGYEGLLKALKSFKPEYGNKFTTYAGHCIIGEIRHYIRRENAYYKPECITSIQRKADVLMEKELDETGEIPSLDYMAEKLNIRAEGLSEVMRAGFVSLDELDLSKISCIRYESFKFPIEDRILLSQAIKRLSEIQKKVIYLLFYRDMSQQQAADVLGINQRKVSRVLQQGLADLKKAW
jgi:RNA polymerase sigma-B factor